MIQVGQKVRFDAFQCIKSSVERIKEHAIGTVVYVNNLHKWFSVEYGNNHRTSFKFSEIGQAVKVVG